MANQLRQSSGAPQMALVTAIAFTLASCQALTNPREASYLGECVKGTIAGGLLGLGADALLNMNDYKSGNISGNIGKRVATKVAIGATAGCAVALAATAVGKALDERERQKEDEAFQQASQKGAAQIEQERQQIAARYRDMPAPSTEAEVVKREETKLRELAQVGTKNQPTIDTPLGSNARAKVRVTGISSVQAKGPSGGNEDCLELEETVTKDGREVKQRSTSCRNHETGGYDRVRVEAA